MLDDDPWDYEDYYDSDPDPCDHEQSDIDILTGRALCLLCGHAWWLTADELKAELAWQAQQYEAMADEHETEAALSGKEE